MPKKNKGPHLWWRADRGEWTIRWYERGIRRIATTGTSDRREAEAALARHLVEVGRPPERPRDPHERLIADVLADYGDERGYVVADPKRLAFSIAPLVAYWGAKPVSAIREASCRAYQRNRLGIGAGTVRRELGTLQAALNHDHRQGRLTVPVWVWKPSPPAPKDRWLTRQEAAALLRAARRDRRARLYLPLFILVGLYTGARKEAVLALRWHQVDLDHGLIDFRDPGKADTNKRRAMMPIPRRLMTLLRLARRRGSDVGYVIARPPSKPRTGRSLPEAHTAPRPLANIRHGFDGAVRRAGLQGVTPHTLRHTCATWLTMSGVPMEETARWLGHTSYATTERVYAHHAPDYLERARNALDRPLRHQYGTRSEERGNK